MRQEDKKNKENPEFQVKENGALYSVICSVQSLNQMCAQWQAQRRLRSQQTSRKCCVLELEQGVGKNFIRMFL